MQYRVFAALDRPMSKLVLGAGSFNSHEHAFEMLDLWRALGGNAMDTAHVYQGGDSERRLGDWIEARACRDDVIVITKGCHPDMNDWKPRVTPEGIDADVADSLARLKTPYVDIYLLHRDDQSVPVGPIWETLNEHVSRGDMLAFGASNWTTARLDAAAEYADARGIAGFCCGSPYLSLARQVEPPWPGCVSAWDIASLQWYERTQLPVLAWSSQANGYFAKSETNDDVPVFAVEDNRQRRQRVQTLALQMGHEPTQVALAWVLERPFAVYALIGPRTTQQLISSVKALEVRLSDEQCDWLRGMGGAEGGAANDA